MTERAMDLTRVTVLITGSIDGVGKLVTKRFAAARAQGMLQGTHLNGATRLKRFSA